MLEITHVHEFIIIKYIEYNFFGVRNIIYEEYLGQKLRHSEIFWQLSSIKLN